MTPTEIVRGFWDAMRENDFTAAADRWLAPDYLGLWPQTGEVMRGPDAFARVNNAFPGQGDWRFEEISLLADGARVVTDMRITNAPLEIAVRCLSFHEIDGRHILRQTEFWPDSYPVPDWRRGLLEVDPAISKW
ncbi:nuclear transport factor 2 family protein [Paracoccus sp. S1E-3]|uniref:nuclear transport factor 2 family protein n=1 Tax=Paracoccus sp. S1E-3 TaxID=2756130 RepID=UPI0015EEA020|nr:nuclear transport factor 2 family protein [Paracoccus sp. S1E-3]MBA4492090.1 nuclear transport factor 2 family protein [Paracoccus sp. S1E-3]